MISTTELTKAYMFGRLGVIREHCKPYNIDFKPIILSEAYNLRQEISPTKYWEVPGSFNKESFMRKLCNVYMLWFNHCAFTYTSKLKATWSAADYSHACIASGDEHNILFLVDDLIHVLTYDIHTIKALHSVTVLILQIAGAAGVDYETFEEYLLKSL